MSVHKRLRRVRPTTRPRRSSIDYSARSKLAATKKYFRHDGQRITAHDELIRPWLAGDAIYSERDNFTIERRDVETLEEIAPPLVGHTLILNSIDDDPASSFVFSQASNGTVRVWDRSSGDQIGREISIGRQSSGTYLDTARDGELVAVMLDTEVALWDYDVGSWRTYGCDLAGRNMTQREWDEFGPSGEPYRITCPQFPANNG